MKAIVKKEAGPGLSLEEVPVPTISDHEVLIKVVKMSICGTDVSIDKWSDWAKKNVPTPLVIGHEFMGVIEELGRGVTGLNIGQRVSAEGHLTCGLCPPCQRGEKHLCPKTRGLGYHVPGCFAEYVKVPAENVFVLPDFVSDNIAAISDPYGNAVHTALSYNLTAEDVLVTGAGPIGIMAALVAQKAGARNVLLTDLSEYRLDLARKMGIKDTLNVAEGSVQDWLKNRGIQYGFTVGMEMSGSPHALNTLLQTAKNGGKIALLGVLPENTGIDWDLVIFKMLQLKGVYGREIYRTWQQMMRLLESGLELENLITHELKVEDYREGFEAMKSGQCGKVILSW